MGMFDNLICDYPLPGGHSVTSVSIWQKVQTKTFQTKDLQQHPNLDTFKITKDGKLLIHNDPKFEEKIYNFTGYCVFYDFVGDPDVLSASRDDQAVGWVEFIAEFERGVLKDIKLRTYEDPDVGSKEGA